MHAVFWPALRGGAAMKVPAVSRQFFTFGLIGAGNTLLDLILFLAFVQALPIPLATFFSASICMAISFLANGRFTFKADHSLRRFLVFVSSTGFVLWIVQPCLILLGQAAIGGSASTPELGFLKLAATGVCMVLNFLSYRFIVWPLTQSLTDPSTEDRMLP